MGLGLGSRRRWAEDGPKMELTGMNVLVGVDFDNTVVSYDDVFHEIAVREGLLPSSVGKSKREIREQLRRLPDGESQWQQLQAKVYGPHMSRATLIDGVPSFLESCKRRGCAVYIVSHKTEFAKYDETETNLRTTAMIWMKDNGFFQPNGLGLSPDNVFFEDTRRDKLERIRKLGCTHFVDDLEETFLERSFPAGVQKILYSPQFSASAVNGVTVANTWNDVCDRIFGGS
jgi:hypothetical protein